jgi:shikimate dehydrogenase
MKLYGVIGYPLGHSFSKKYFTQKFTREGITDCRYELFPITSLDELKDILKQYPEIAGINITIPYKQQVLRYLYSAEHIPLGLRACNCIKIVNGNLFGYNTDVIGFERSLLPQLKNYHNNALILGNGGAAEAVRFVLNKLNIVVKTVSRKLHDGSDLTYADLNEKIMSENLLVVNTTPLGTFPNTGECADIPYQYLTARHFLYDLVYNPEKSLFLQKGEEYGAAIKNGHEMLVIQAEESWNIWNTKS